MLQVLSVWLHAQNKHGFVNEDSVCHRSAMGVEVRPRDAISKMFKVEKKDAYSIITQASIHHQCIGETHKKGQSDNF